MHLKADKAISDPYLNKLFVTETSPYPLSFQRTVTEKEGRGFFWHLKAAAKRVASTAMRKREWARGDFLSWVD